MSTDLSYMNAIQISTMIRSKKLSCHEFMQHCLQKIADLNPKINAIVAQLDEEKSLSLATLADEAISKGEKIGPLHGIPMAVKEMHQVKGWRSTYAWAAGVQEPSLAPLGFNKIQETDGLLASRMRKAGSLFIGKTNIPTFGFGSHTKNDLFGACSNPYQLQKTVGGSSGGAAASLAAGMLPLADGSDLGGSLRNPAAFCNVIGFRPSIGRIPIPHSGWAARMLTEGPMARSVQDIALLLSVQAGSDLSDPLSLSTASSLFQSQLSSEVKGIRIGWTSDFGYLPVAKSVKTTAQKSLDYFKDMGLVISQNYPDIMRPYPIDAMDVFRILRVLNIAPIIQNFRKTIGIDGIKKFMNPICQYQLLDAYDQIDQQAIYLANENRTRIYQLFLSFFEKHDFLICPTTQVPPFDNSIDYVRNIEGQPMHDYLEWMSICCILSITGLPVISMPCGFTEEGLPIGIQIVGKPGADLEVLRLAYAFEQASGLSMKYPGNRPAL